ncbi:MAG TPA: hypothetical protein VHE61_19205 [Opitutaceae bacterium]|nr:hypothetical protein [Opitutaceae bacterium]
MPTPAPALRPAATRPALSPVRHLWWLALLAGLAVLAVATRRRIDRVDALTNSPTWSTDAPRRDRASATGFTGGQRTLIVPGEHTPSYAWIMEAQQAASEGRWRLRRVSYDAPPKGREISRTAPYRWWLTTVGWLRGAATGDSLGYSIERGALIADPLLLALLLVAGTLYSARYFGPFAAGGFALGCVALFPLAANFQPGAPDPHALAWVLALASVLPLLTPPRGDDRARRRQFVLAGIMGGLGFWNEATSQAPVLLAVFLGAIGCELMADKGTPGSTRPWRAWALAGAVTTLAASAFEFAPHFSWSLGAVNPVQAVAWWGLGELLTGVATWRTQGREGLARRSLARVIAGGIAAAAWPVVGIASHSGALRAADFYALQLANLPNGIMAPSLGVWLRRPGEVAAKWATLLPAVLGIVVLVRLTLGKITREERGRLLLAVVTMAVAGFLACLQLRWWNLFDVLALAGLAALLAGDDTGPARWKRCGVLLVFVPGLFAAFPAAVDGQDGSGITPPDAQSLVTRDFSYWLAKRAGDEPQILYSTPIFSSAAAYYGGFGVIVSSDEENQTGYLAAVRIANAGSLDEASVLLQSRGVTRVVLPAWDSTLAQLIRKTRHLPENQPLPDDAFVAALMRWESPVWMRPLDYRVPASTGLQDFGLTAYALQAPVDPDLFLSRLADFFIERGMLPAAQSVSDSLKSYPRSIVALGARANVALARREDSLVTTTVEALIPYLSRIAARHLPADRRISLATLLYRTHHDDLARQQLTTCLQTLEPAMLRTLTPNALGELFGLTRALNVPITDPKIQTAALGLLPPGVRAGLER